MSGSPSPDPVAVTGAGGFIGSHVVRALLAEGMRVRALVRYTSEGRAGFLDDIAPALAPDERARLEIVRGDLTDRACVDALAAGTSAVLHLAALVGIPYSYRAPESYVRVNVAGTLNVLEAARRSGRPRVIVTSTSEVYGTARTAPIREDHPLQAQSPYAASKIAAEKLGEAFHLSLDLPVVIVRPFNCFGPRQSPRAVVPTILAQLLSDACPVVRLGRTDPTRDLTFVTDTAAGFVRLLRAPADAVAGRVFNMGSGTERSIGEIAAIAMRAVGITKEIRTDEARMRPDASEVMRLLADSTAIREATGWTPAADFEEGLRATAAWITARRGGPDPSQYAI